MLQRSERLAFILVLQFQEISYTQSRSAYFTLQLSNTGIFPKPSHSQYFSSAIDYAFRIALFIQLVTALPKPSSQPFCYSFSYPTYTRMYFFYFSPPYTIENIFLFLLRYSFILLTRDVSRTPSSFLPISLFIC